MNAVSLQWSPQQDAAIQTVGEWLKEPAATRSPIFRLFGFAVDAFEPTRPFDAFRDDPVGVDRTLVDHIEGRKLP